MNIRRMAETLDDGLTCTGDAVSPMNTKTSTRHSFPHYGPTATSIPTGTC